MHTKFLSEYLKGRNHCEDLSVDGRILLDWILGKRDGVRNYLLDSSGSG
jgi:hypothetical protein